MKTQKLYSILTAAGLIVAVLPGVALGESSIATFPEPYVPDIGAAPSQYEYEAQQIPFGELPAPVQATVRAQRGTDVISRITTEKKSGRMLYCIQFKKHSDHPRPELVVAPNGTIVKEKHMASSVGGPEVVDVPVNR
jgi:hypothetical protein